MAIQYRQGPGPRPYQWSSGFGKWYIPGSGPFRTIGEFMVPQAGWTTQKRTPEGDLFTEVVNPAPWQFPSGQEADYRQLTFEGGKFVRKPTTQQPPPQMPPLGLPPQEPSTWQLPPPQQLPQPSQPVGLPPTQPFSQPTPYGLAPMRQAPQISFGAGFQQQFLPLLMQYLQRTY